MMSGSKTEKTENASTTDSTKGKRRRISPPKDIGDNVKTDVAMVNSSEDLSAMIRDLNPHNKSDSEVIISDDSIQQHTNRN